MPCYHPKVRIEDLTKWETAADGHKYHPAKIFGKDLLDKQGYVYHRNNERYQLIPCRNCIGCRLDYSRQWANRGYLEMKYHKETWFVTLTYDDDHLPLPEEVTTKDGITYTDNGKWNTGILDKNHFTRFLHDIRQIYERETGKTGIKFMGCGEYGDPKKTFRPHYHFILYGIEFPTKTLYEPRFSEGNVYYRQKWIEQAWKYGISNVSEANWQTIAYVARYITKKINGEGSEDQYAAAGKIKEFFRASRGIGKQYYIDNKDKIYKTDKITVAHGDQAITSTPPKYFDYLLEKEDKEKSKKLKKKRIRLSENSFKKMLEKTEKTYVDELEVMERTHEQRSKALTRKLEKE